MESVKGADIWDQAGALFRTVFRDNLRSRQICLIDLPSTKNARLIFAIVSTTNIPNPPPKIF